MMTAAALAIIGALGCSSAPEPPVVAPDRAPLADVVVLPLTTRNTSGLLGHAVDPSGRRPERARRVTADQPSVSTTHQHVTMVRRISTDAELEGTLMKGLRLGAEGRRVSHLRYDVWISGYVDMPEPPQYEPASDCCAAGEVTPPCRSGYVGRLLRGSGTIEYLREINVGITGEMATIGHIGTTSHYQVLDRTSFEDAFFAFETRPLEPVCALVDDAILFEATVVTPPPNCEARAFFVSGRSQSMDAVWLPDLAACTAVVSAFCHAQTSIRCDGSFLVPGADRTVPVTALADHPVGDPPVSMQRTPK